jgi:uncharacterized protein YecA (UPF0149 family)
MAYRIKESVFCQAQLEGKNLELAEGLPFQHLFSLPKKYPGTGRNDPYPCGSGRKYKKNCGSAR